MYVSATTRAVPPASNLTTLGIASNRWHGQWPSARQDERRRKCVPSTRKSGSRFASKARTLQARSRRVVARLKQRFVMAPWIAADES